MKNRMAAWGVLLIPFTLRGGFDVRFTPEGPVTETTSGTNRATEPVEGLVVVPVTDLRRDPISVSPQAATKRPFPIDEKQKTQLLYGERVLVRETVGDWARVEAPDQLEFDAVRGWRGCDGWMWSGAILARPQDFYPSAVVIVRTGRVRQSKKIAASYKPLPLGARVGVIYTEKGWVRVQGPRGEIGWMRTHEVRLDREAPKQGMAVREAVTAAATQLLGEPYYRGGRCAAMKRQEIPTGVDDSALVHLAYRAVCLNAPRNVQDQFRIARPLDSGNDLLPGDLVFLAKKDAPERIVHVLLFEKKETLIEADPESDGVRRVSFKKKMGGGRGGLRSGKAAGEWIVRFGAFLE